MRFAVGQVMRVPGVAVLVATAAGRAVVVVDAEVVVAVGVDVAEVVLR